MKHYTCRDVCGCIDTFAPPRFALEGDPIGLHLGSFDQKTDRLFLTLELTGETAAEAMDFRPDMIFVHHTPFFSPLKQLCENDGHDQIILDLIRSRIALYTAHTNLDCVAGGVNDVLAGLLGLSGVEILQPLSQHVPEAGLGRIGNLPDPVTLAEFARLTDLALGAGGVRYAGRGDQMVGRVAVCGGAGAFLMEEAKTRGADAFVTADVKRHDSIRAVGLGLGVVDGGHFATEAPVIPILASYVRDNMPGLEVASSKRSCNPFTYAAAEPLHS